jgi:hypothetical protein
LPVTFGTTTTLTGAGTWTYPDVGLVIGLKLDVTDPGVAARNWGTEIVRYREVGVWAPITEAGKMHSQPFWNDQEVTYDVGNGPVGLAYDIEPGVTITATEILSETPPSGGGGGVIGTILYDSGAATSIPSGVWTQCVPDTVLLHTADAVISTDGTGGVNVHQHGVYFISTVLYIGTGTTVSNAICAVYLNGTQLWGVSAPYEPLSGGYNINLALAWQFAVSDNVTVFAYQDSGSTHDSYLSYNFGIRETL